MAREQAFGLGARPEKLILDVDATLVGSHSDKEQAAGNYKHGFGFHPMLCYLDGTDGALDGILRPGNAGSNTGADQTRAVELAMQQLPEDCMTEKMLMRGDSAACVHDLIDFLQRCPDAVLRRARPQQRGTPGDQEAPRDCVGPSSFTRREARDGASDPSPQSVCR